MPKPLFAIALVKTQELPWLQLHDPKCKLYEYVHGLGAGVPYCLLLDREGRVITISARGEVLKQKLEELFR